LKETRKIDTMYSIISFFLSGLFFWVVVWSLTQQEIDFSSWEFWENTPLIFLALFFLGAGIYGLSRATKGEKEKRENASASREIAKMAVLLVALAIALWIMFHFGFK
jgi:hypothetical protein